MGDKICQLAEEEPCVSATAAIIHDQLLTLHGRLTTPNGNEYLTAGRGTDVYVRGGSHRPCTVVTPVEEAWLCGMTSTYLPHVVSAVCASVSQAVLAKLRAILNSIYMNIYSGLSSWHVESHTLDDDLLW